MSFFQELVELQKTEPRIGSVRLNHINSEYTQNTDQCKNCYMLANAVKNEDCLYGRDFYNNEDCVDCDHIWRCISCYECINAKECWNCKGLQDCWNCSDCEYGYDLKGCQDCIGCVGLRKKSFHVFNKPYPKEEYLKIKKELNAEEISEKFEQLKKETPRVYAIQISVENCVGENIFHSQNAYFTFDIDECQDVMYVEESKNLKDCCDIFILEDSELCYECSCNHILNNCNFCYLCCDSDNLDYCELCFNCKDCFGCVSLHRKQYCILNKQYIREEYFQKIAELKKEAFYGKLFLGSTYPVEDTVLNWPCL